jgi:hypothetical protein
MLTVVVELSCVHDGPSPSLYPSPSTSVFYPYTCYQMEVFTIIRLRTRLRTETPEKY